MQIKIISIPALGDRASSLADELNSFLKAHRIVNITKEFVADRENSLWCFCIEYEEGSNNSSNSRFGIKIDYKAKLSEDEFARFCIMRECRKKIADELGVPAYTIFVDSELAELCKTELDKISSKTLTCIQGFGEKKLERFGIKFLELIKERIDEKNRLSLPANSGNKESESSILESPKNEN